MNHWRTYEQRLSEYWIQYGAKVENALGRFFQYLPQTDLTLITLKGHLLIEESINELFQRLLKAPTALEDARLSFFQQVCLAQAIMDDIGGHPGFWRSIKRLNSIRNKYAHKVDPSNIQQEISYFINEVFEAAGKNHEEIEKELKIKGIEQLLRVGIISVFLGIRALIDGLDAAKSYPVIKNNS